MSPSYFANQPELLSVAVDRHCPVQLVLGIDALSFAQSFLEHLHRFHSPSRRCTHLADLGTRLAAVCIDLRRHRMPEAALGALERLAADLASCSGEETPTGGVLEALWERALTVLARAAGHGEPRLPGLPGTDSGKPRPAAAGDGSGVTAADAPPRTGFWRRS